MLHSKKTAELLSACELYVKEYAKLELSSCKETTWRSRNSSSLISVSSNLCFTEPFMKT